MGRFPRICRVVSLFFGLLCGCGQGPHGHVLELEGDFDRWGREHPVTQLEWTGDRYYGMALLPAGAMNFKLFSRFEAATFGPTTEQPMRAVPTRIAVTPSPVDQDPLWPFRVSLPFPGRYEFEYVPGAGVIHVDFADDPSPDRYSPMAVELITALRRSDTLLPSEQSARGQELVERIRRNRPKMPLRQSDDVDEFISFWHFGKVDYPSMTVISDETSWGEARKNEVAFALDNNVGYWAGQATVNRHKYLFNLHGKRFLDPLNPEVVWNGDFPIDEQVDGFETDPGQLHSLAFGPNYRENGPRWRRYCLQSPIPTLPRPEILVRLPGGYDEKGLEQSRHYPVVFWFVTRAEMFSGYLAQLLDDAVGDSRAVQVFVPPPTDYTERTGLFVTEPNTRFPHITPRGPQFAEWFDDTLVPHVEKVARISKDRVLIGVGAAASWSIQRVWTGGKTRLNRVMAYAGAYTWNLAGGETALERVIKTRQPVADDLWVVFDDSYWDIKTYQPKEVVKLLAESMARHPTVRVEVVRDYDWEKEISPNKIHGRLPQKTALRVVMHGLEPVIR